MYDYKDFNPGGEGDDFARIIKHDVIDKAIDKGGCHVLDSAEPTSETLNLNTEEELHGKQLHHKGV